MIITACSVIKEETLNVMSDMDQNQRTTTPQPRRSLWSVFTVAPTTITSLFTRVPTQHAVSKSKLPGGGLASPTASSTVLQVEPTPHRLVLRQIIEDIFLNLDADGSTILDGITARDIKGQASVRRQHMTTKGNEIAVCDVANERNAMAPQLLVTLDRAGSDL